MEVLGWWHLIYIYLQLEIKLLHERFPSVFTLAATFSAHILNIWLLITREISVQLWRSIISMLENTNLGSIFSNIISADNDWVVFYCRGLTPCTSKPRCTKKAWPACCSDLNSATFLGHITFAAHKMSYWNCNIPRLVEVLHLRKPLSITSVIWFGDEI